MTTRRAEPSPWRTAEEAASRARCSKKLIYYEVKQQRLRAARCGGRRALRFLDSWIDQWLEATSTPIEIVRR